MHDYSKYLKIPWKDNGRSFDGCDCWGWCLLFCKHECAIDIADLQYSSCLNVTELEKLAVEEKKKWQEIDITAAQKGDLVDLSMTGRDYHMGVMIDDKRIGHLEINSFPVIVNKNSFKICQRIRGVWRYAR